MIFFQYRFFLLLSLLSLNVISGQKIGDACKGDGDCQNPSFSCINNECSCGIPSTVPNGDGNLCLIGASEECVDNGVECTENSSCVDVSGDGSHSVCTCDAGFTQTSGVACDNPASNESGSFICCPA